MSAVGSGESRDVLVLGGGWWKRRREIPEVIWKDNCYCVRADRKLTKLLIKTKLVFLTPMRIIREAIASLGSPAPILVSEGANTMDVGRSVLVQMEPRTCLDVGTWGTIGVGLGYCIATAIASPDRLVVEKLTVISNGA
ncbi:unnamed protein product [Lactuca virosa]|uniref:Uncharacterized protein n=1 Tax=Lactuca virosa TaxID=75947 RepID=A0AAU9MNY5_9ASTR|nr:unnamed protein product [Lactuca virosa]